MITLTDVNKEYHTKQGKVVALDNINLNIKEKEIFGIIGYSGAGKSTLIRLLNGLEKPTSGNVEVAGQSIGNLKGEKLRQARHEISMIFQHFNILWSRTVFENISFPLEIAKVPKAERAKRVNELIKLVGLEGREHSYPSQLSGGQKQRVGIARALAVNPKVLLCDEATSALDPETTNAILHLLVDINKKLGLTIVLITHEMNVIKKICHRVAVMEKGKVVEEGSALDVFQSPKQQITKSFVQQSTHTDEAVANVELLTKKYPNGKIVKLSFVGDTAGQPVITQVIRKFPITLNIVEGSLSQTNTGSFGEFYVYLEGESVELENAIAFIKEHQVGVEVLEHA